MLWSARWRAIFLPFSAELKIEPKEELEEEKHSKMTESEPTNEESESGNGWWFGLSLNTSKNFSALEPAKK